MRRASAIAYSSSANLGPGYDVLALCHNSYYDRVTVTADDTSGRGNVKIFSDSTPLNPLENTAGLALVNLMDEKGIQGNVSVRIEKGIPFGLGLGSSGASSAAAVSAANMLFNLGMHSEEMAYFAMKGETAASGTPHADNVSASIFGDMVIVNSISPLKVSRVKVAPEFSLMLVIPHVIIRNKTRMAREMVPADIPMDDYVRNSRHLSSLIAGLVAGDRDLVREGMNDEIVEKARSSLFPFYSELKDAALSLDAAGVSVSGAGPSVLVVCDRHTKSVEIEAKAGRIMRKYGHEWTIARSEISSGVLNENPDAYS